jgi:hypothetical protein
MGQLEIGHSGSRGEVTRRTYKLLRSSSMKVEENCRTAGGNFF